MATIQLVLPKQTQENYKFVTRRARLTDVPAMMPLLNDYASQAEILPRNESDVYQFDPKTQGC